MKKFPTPKKYRVRNPEKYIGDPTNVIFRSSWELKFCRWADKHPGVSKWFSEEMCVQYISPLDGKLHRYFPDFGMIMSDGKRYVVEIKPHSQSVMPKQGNKKAKTYLAECATYSVNQAKWKAAKAFFDKQGIKFIVVTEYELGLKKR